MRKQEIYSKIRVRKNQSGAKSEGVQKLKVSKLKAQNLKGHEF